MLVTYSNCSQIVIFINKSILKAMCHYEGSSSAKNSQAICDHTGEKGPYCAE